LRTFETVATETPADAAIVASVVRPACRPPADRCDAVRGPPSDGRVVRERYPGEGASRKLVSKNFGSYHPYNDA